LTALRDWALAVLDGAGETQNFASLHIWHIGYQDFIEVRLLDN
jgi:hypothetical protein